MIILAAALGVAMSAAADFEVVGPDGRRILLKDDLTWRYLESSEGGAAGASPAGKSGVAGEALLRLERRDDAAGGCRFSLQLANHLPYAIQSIVPTFSAVRANGVVYDSVTAGFISLRPGDVQTHEISFRGMTCSEIAGIKVSGGDRCVMGELDRFSPAEGQCLARVRILDSDFVRFGK